VLIWASSFVALAGGVRAATADADNPYSDTIVGRNVFSLKEPPPPPNPEDLIKKDPPPKILLQGLTTILGRKQVLFKVQQPAKPGQPAQEESFVSAEGERQGEIEVLEIDEIAGVVKFDNHGTIEPKNMKDDVAQATAGPSPQTKPLPPGVIPPTIPGLPRPTAAVNPVRPTAGSVAHFGGSSSRFPTRTLRTSTMAVGGVPSVLGGAQTAQTIATAPSVPVLSREEQEIMIEVNRQRYLDQGDPRARIMPPTSMTSQRQPPNAP